MLISRKTNQCYVRLGYSYFFMIQGDDHVTINAAGAPGYDPGAEELLRCTHATPE